MNKYINALLIAVAIILLPSLVVAQYDDSQPFADYGWYSEPAIEITGPPDIIFPVQGVVNFSDDFGDGRSGGRVHEGNDLIAPKLTPILAARGGRIVSAATTEPSYGYLISIVGDDGYRYNYLHINNDTPGTDDGQGGLEYAYAPGISQGVTVTQGQHIAWVGDSGNAESTVSHLHFEIRLADDTAINPFPYLHAALEIYGFDVDEAKYASRTINEDKGLVADPNIPSYCVSGSLIRIPSVSSVYYCGADGKRYVFPNTQTYNTWYADFSTVQVIAPEQMSKIMLGGNVTYRPGVKLVKIQTDSRVYAVSHDGTLRLMITPAIAEKYYGKDWNKKVEDIPDAFFTNYTVGDSVNN